MRRELAVLCSSAIAIGLLLPGPASAEPTYWDASADPGIQAGDGVWDNAATAGWSDSLSGSSPLLPWSSPTNDAVFYTGGASAVNVGTVAARSLTFAGGGYTLNGGEITVGAGGITVNQSATINSPIVFGASQTVTNAGGTMLGTGSRTYIGSGVTVTKTGAGAWGTGERACVGSDPSGAGVLAVDQGNMYFNYLLLGYGGSAASTGVLNVSGGLVNTGMDLYVGCIGNGAVHQTGGLVVVDPRASGAGVLFCTDANDATGIYNLDGGTLRTPNLFTHAGGATRRTAQLNFGGGTLENNGNWDMVADITTVINSGGATFSTPTALANIVMNGTISGEGSLTKTGIGTLDLAGTVSYAGDTTVTGGALTLHSPFLSDHSTVSISDGLLNLEYSGADVIGALWIGGVEQAIGVWGAVGSGAQHESALISGTGFLSTVPEPSASVSLCAGLLGLAAYAWRKRK